MVVSYYECKIRKRKNIKAVATKLSVRSENFSNRHNNDSDFKNFELMRKKN